MSEHKLWTNLFEEGNLATKQFFEKQKQKILAQLKNPEPNQP